MAEKLFYSMGEVSEMFDVNPSLLRHWESQFDVLRPKRNKKGNRLFTPQDVENLKIIYHLVMELGMTLDGAKKAIKQQRGSGDVDRKVELMERLQRIRSLLVEVREDLKAAPSEVVPDPDAAPTPQRKTRSVARAKTEDSDAADAAADPSVKPIAKRSRKSSNKDDEGDHKELFAFYEQSLF